MKNKKGFTLIELLAVIVVLAIILVIAGTNVIRYINTAKEKAKYIAAKEIVNIAEAYMEANNLNAVTVGDLMRDDVGYLEEDATNPRTGENSWSDVEKNQFIIQEKTATAQSNSEIQNGTYYGFDGYYYVVDTSKIALNDVKTAGGMTSCYGQKILINGNCITINNNLVDSDTPEVEENEPAMPEVTPNEPEEEGDNEPKDDDYQDDICNKNYDFPTEIKNFFESNKSGTLRSSLNYDTDFKNNFSDGNKLATDKKWKDSEIYRGDYSSLPKLCNLETNFCEKEGDYIYFNYNNYCIKLYTNQ